jgi:two-component system response regulator YesN
MNINFQDYLTKVRIGQAKILLEQNKHKIKEVAELTGFNSQYYFSLAFKKIEGISPSDFMKKIAGERYFVNKADTIDFHKS